MVREARGQSRTDENHCGLRECSLGRHSSGEIVWVDMMREDDMCIVCIEYEEEGCVYEEWCLS